VQPALALGALIARAQAQRASAGAADALQAQADLARAQAAQQRLLRRREAEDRVAQAQQALAELTLAELPEGDPDPDAILRSGLENLFAGRRPGAGQGNRAEVPRVGGSRQQSRIPSRAASPPRGPPGAGGVGPAGVAGQPLAPVPNPGSIVKVQSAPQFKGKTYSAYITWEVQFEFWAKRQRLWALYLGTVSPPAAAGYTPALLAEHAVALQQYAANQEWAFGELVQALALDEHVQLILEFKGDNSNPPSPHEAWMRIRALFMRDLPTSKIQLTRILGQLLLQEGESIMDFWRRASNIRTRHEAVLRPDGPGGVAWAHSVSAP